MSPLHAASRFCCTLCIALCAMAAPQLQAAPLAGYNVDPATVSVSGLSSGGFMAMQLGVAYSGTFRKGVGIIAGGTYDCAGQMSYSLCMYNQTPSVTQSISNMHSWSGGQIDATANIASQKIYLFTGTNDTTVGPHITDQVYKLYVTTGAFVSSANVRYDNTSTATHTFPTDFDSTGNNACSNSASPYISNCSFDGAGATLQQIYGTLTARNNGTLGGSLIQFDQTAFITGNGMDTTGWLYVPANCASGQACRLHVALHGCLQYQGTIGTKFVTNTGYNKWADTNNIIVLYPQTVADSTSHATAASGSLGNPNGCWDWIGWYGGSAFDKKGGVQMAALVAMVNKITSGFSGGGLPAAPTSLAVSGTTSSSVSLTWTAVSGATSYNVYRNGAKVGSGTGASFTDSGLAASTTYAYAVSAVNASGEGAQSASVNATTQAGGGSAPPAPGSLSVTGTTTSSVSLGWSASTGATAYNVYRGSAKVSSPTGTSYTDTGLAAATTYSYSVSASNANGESTKTGPVNASTQAAATCYTSSNYAHVTAGRAHDGGGYALANGSNQNMGLDNVFYTTTLKKTGTNYYVIGTCP